MKKRITNFLTVIALLITLLHSYVLAAGTVTLDTISDKKPGDEVIISDTTTLDKVTVKVLRPNNIVLYIKVLKGSHFQDKFTLSGDAMEGIYTIIVGHGTSIDTKTFKVAKTSEIVRVTGATLDKSSLSLQIGSTYHLTATVLPDNATNKNETWHLAIVVKPPTITDW